MDPSGADVQAWIEGPQGGGNVALRLPRGVYGLDVDEYGGKTGGAALRRLMQECGPLPATWIVSSRDDGVSGIRLFQADLPAGRRWRDEPAGHSAGIEAIHFGHRYAVVWPSIHPETGRKYVWTRPDGLTVDGEVPALDALPMLPATWIEGLSEPGEIRVGEMAGHDETIEAVTGWRDDEPCPRVQDARDRALRGMAMAVDGAALHPVSVTGVHELVNLGHEGHAGVRRALAEHYALHVEIRAGRGNTRDVAEAEWWRAVRGATGKLPGAPVARCDCDLWSGEGLLFDPMLPVGSAEPDDLFDGPAPITIDGEVVNEESAGTLVGEVLQPLSLADALDARVLTVAQMRVLPPPVQLVEGLLCLDSESWLIAKSSSYKTFVALDIAGHVAAGRPWMGRPVVQGGIFYLVAEGIGGMPQRVRAWEQRNGPMENVAFLPVPVQVKREDHWAALVEVCRRRQPVLIILDTQARISVGLQENDNSEMGELIEAIGRLRRATGACVLVVHHLGRSGQDARGASAIDGAQDSELRLTRTADLRVVLETDKQRHLADDARVEMELFPCELDDGGTSLVVGPPVSGPVATAPWREGLTENQALIMDVLVEHFSEQGGTKSEIRAVLNERGPKGDAEYAKSSFYLAWNALLEKDRISQVHGTQRFVAAVPNA